MIILYSHFEVKPGHEEEFLAACKPVIQKARAIKGNTSYHLMKVFDEKDIYKLVGFWDDMDAYKSHSTSEYLKDYVQKSTNFLSIPIERTLVSGEITSV